MSLRSSVDAEAELAQLMASPPQVEAGLVKEWISRLQSLLAELKRSQVRERRRVGGAR